MNQKYTEEILRGKKYHALAYVPNSLRIEGHDTVCQWKCDCGNEIIAKARFVIQGRKRSCTCYAYRKRQHSPQWTGVGDMPGSYWNNVQNNARHRGIRLQLSQQAAWSLFLSQNRKCAVTGVELRFDSGYDKTDGNASLDRIDPSQPYRAGNVQWVHKDINNMKKGLTQERFVDWCRKVVEHSA